MKNEKRGVSCRFFLFNLVRFDDVIGSSSELRNWEDHKCYLCVKYFKILSYSKRRLIMSFIRTFVAAVAAMGLATVAFAADESTMQNSGNTSTQAIQVADSSDSSGTDASATTDQQKVNVNTATTKELMKVKGLTATRAKAIYSYRKKHGEFKSLDDLKQVRGFKKLDPKTMQEIQDQLTLG